MKILKRMTLASAGVSVMYIALAALLPFTELSFRTWAVILGQMITFLLTPLLGISILIALLWKNEYAGDAIKGVVTLFTVLVCGLGSFFICIVILLLADDERPLTRHLLVVRKEYENSMYYRPIALFFRKQTVVTDEDKLDYLSEKYDRTFFMENGNGRIYEPNHTELTITVRLRDVVFTDDYVEQMTVSYLLEGYEMLDMDRPCSMIEAGADEIPEDKMLEAIYLCHGINQTIIEFINKIVEEAGKPKHEYTSCAIPEEMFAAIKEIVPPEEMEEAVFSDDKQVREENIRKVTEKLEEAFADNEEWLAILGEAIYQYQKKTVRKMILKDHKRPDGRQITEIRPLAAEVDLIPRVHGSAMFTRGQTQICTITTLAPLSEKQKVDGLDIFTTEKRYMHHYNFPSYSVGETKPSRGPGRREIGHGSLAEKALVPVLPSEEEFPYTIRTVSETFESNGSTSQASICASTMSLMAAGVPIKKPVAGISCGLVTGETDDDYIVLTDIQGLEDFFGDMDFKVAGTKDGITAIQMDIKIHGLTKPIVEEAISRTREARMYILDNVMLPAISEPRKNVGKYAPKIIQMQIDPMKIGDVVGQRGKTINALIERTNVKIDISDEGMVSICGEDEALMAEAKRLIEIIVTDFYEGQVLEGEVINIKEFGAFLEFAPGKEGMVHISKIAKERINHVEDILTLGDRVKAVCLGKDKMGRISFSIKDVK